MPKFKCNNKVNVPKWATPELARMIVGHDIFYAFSDDRWAYSNGQDEVNAMVQEIQSIRPCERRDALNILDEIYKG